MHRRRHRTLRWRPYTRRRRRPSPPSCSVPRERVSEVHVSEPTPGSAQGEDATASEGTAASEDIATSEDATASEGTAASEDIATSEDATAIEGTAASGPTRRDRHATVHRHPW